MQFLAHSQGTVLSAEYKYLEPLCLESSLFTLLHSFTNLYTYPNKHTYSRLDLHSLQQTSKCLQTTANARSCVEPLVPAAPSNAVQPALDAPSCEEQPVLAAQSNVVPLVPDALSCKWQHPVPRRITLTHSSQQYNYPTSHFLLLLLNEEPTLTPSRHRRTILLHYPSPLTNIISHSHPS
jgi:hypothetical protein